MSGYDCGFLWYTPLLVYLQPTKLSDAQALPTSWLGGSTRGQPGGHVHIKFRDKAGGLECFHGRLLTRFVGNSDVEGTDPQWIN